MSEARLDPARCGDLPLALHAASAVLGARAGVVVAGAWTPVETPDGARWGLPVRLDLLGVPPTAHVPSRTSWVVTVNAEDQTVRVYPARASDALAATFPHQEYNGRIDPTWDVRSGYLCTQTSTHKLAQGRAGTYDEPVDLFDRVLWHVERTAGWLRKAATDTLVVAGDPFELPDFRTRGPDPSALATHEDAASLARWRGAPRAGIAEFAILGTSAAPVAVVKAWFGPHGAELFRPAWGTYVAEKAGQRSALWLRLDEFPVVEPWQAPATGTELLAAARTQGLDPREILNSPVAASPGCADPALAHRRSDPGSVRRCSHRHALASPPPPLFSCGAPSHAAAPQPPRLRPRARAQREPDLDPRE